MRLSRVSTVLLLTLVVGLSFAQESEDSTTPKRVLKKYRVRRPVIVDDQGNVVRAGPRLRRVRVKNPKPTAETATTTVVTSTTSTSSTSSSSSPAAPQIQPQTQHLRQRTSQNAIPLERQVQRVVQPQAQQQQQQQVFYEEREPAVVEPIRTVPLAYRQPTSQDGSFTFGYEAEDGSFKEETRGVDCVVRGKYGYIDPEGVRREFEYVSGNPCDPNNPNPEEQADEEEDALAPSRPILRQRVRPSELSENNIQQGLQQQGLVLRQRVRITTPAPSPTFATNQAEDEDQPSLLVRQKPFPSFQSIRPSVFQDVSQSLEEDTNRRPPGFGRGLFNFDQEVFGNAAFRQEQATASPPPTSPQSSQIPPPTSSFGGNRYRTELVYDPQSGQYTSVQVQANPHTNEEFELTQKLRAYSVNPSPSPSPVTYTSAPTFSTPTGAGAYTQIQQFGQPQIQYYHQSEPPQGRSVNSPHPQPQDPSQINQFLARHAYQQQEQQQQTQTSNLQFIPPHLRPGAHQTAEIQRQEVRELNFPSPSSNLQSGLSANSAAASNGQIDAFLRALNISI
ncbi:Larval cuticle protein A1A [Folsomia candida]|uniref:Larval cuticle protein A1A n=1 Tax=Folsomia candida TaxID=158441 RepID=A0A226E0X2_FOLCA|nr:Larval cuticle protein A1A [Folsomia candida]